MNVNILSVRTVTSADPARHGKKDTVVTYGIEGQGTNFFIMPADAPTEDEIWKAVEDHVGALHPAHGQSRTIG